MVVNPSFRFPLPLRIKESQIDFEEKSNVLGIGEKLHSLSLKHSSSKDSSSKEEFKSHLIPSSTEKPSSSVTLTSKLQPGLDPEDVYVKAGFTTTQGASQGMDISKERREELNDLAVGAQKANLAPKIGKRKLKKLKKEEREKNKGPGWFGMKAPEMTEENRRDLEILQMRSVLDPKRFYKKNDLKSLPKYFQVGHVLDSPVDYYSDRRLKKDRKKTLVDELMADAEFKKQNKRKYVEIIEQERKHTRKYTKKKKKAAL